MRRAQIGITKLEFITVVMLIVALAGTLLSALREQQEQAEKLGVELAVMSMRTGLLAEMADRLINGKGKEADDLIGINPVRWLKAPPQGYLGEFKDLNERLIAPGSWYFDQNAGELVYKLNISSHFRRVDGTGRQEIRWRAQVRDGKAGKASVENLVLVPTVAYEWF